MGFWGGGVGIYMGLFNLIMVKYVGRETLLAQFAILSFFSSFWTLSCGPLIGKYNHYQTCCHETTPVLFVCISVVVDVGRFVN